ncbi:ankyrin repeat domain-containing protein [Paenibacillus sp. MWE-103]|uniref:Ankyrin repeat domain-containing protein n=1 Tax=Paenibacillus artemisiicola TaxID=1172618 RepID=A0ABS3WFH3_9BACL|nr:ankyrin repeat domain-containing protein [Paenibacillus artemisiicola]MBO7746860.1 ankyrin repeat domain-containing protein [Paenibacillus artemisiicola]
MNRFIRAVRNADLDAVRGLLREEPKWLAWSEEDGKNALHHLCGLDASGDPRKAANGLPLLKLLLGSGMDINAVHRIASGSAPCGFFPATPLWYAYTRGRNDALVSYLLAEGANPGNCQFAIAWNDDVEAAELFRRYGAEIDGGVFLAAYKWKRFAIAEWLLKHGADVDEADEAGNTALHHAVKRRDPAELLQLLLRHGADAEQANTAGVTPKALAEANNRKKALTLFAAT